MVRPDSGSRSFAAILGLHITRAVVGSTSQPAEVGCKHSRLFCGLASGRLEKAVIKTA